MYPLCVMCVSPERIHRSRSNSLTFPNYSLAPPPPPSPTHTQINDVGHIHCCHDNRLFGTGLYDFLRVRGKYLEKGMCRGRAV